MLLCLFKYNFLSGLRSTQIQGSFSVAEQVGPWRQFDNKCSRLGQDSEFSFEQYTKV